jgi:hypothetical protein
VRPTPGFAESISSKEICISSADSIVALIRLFRSQHGLARSPVLLIYSAVVAGSGILYTQNPAALALEKDRRLSFILKSLAECSETHPLANEGRVKLQANIDGRRSSAVKERVTDSSSPTGLEGYPVSAAANMFDFNSYDPTFDFSVFDSPDLSISGAIGESLLPMSTGFTQAPDPAQTWSYGEASGDQNAPTSYIFDDPMLGFSPQDFDDTR